MKTIYLALSMFIASIVIWPTYLFLIGILYANKIILFYEASFLPAIYILYVILLFFLAHKFNVNVIDNNIKSIAIKFPRLIFALNVVFSMIFSLFSSLAVVKINHNIGGFNARNLVF